MFKCKFNWLSLIIAQWPENSKASCIMHFTATLKASFITNRLAFSQADKYLRCLSSFEDNLITQSSWDIHLIKLPHFSVGFE